jgi:glycosyltransferase involved in cell wall biosynthesis
MNPISVSVIIPTYNRARTVTRAIDSVLSQTHRKFEIIVIDDGSKDETREVLKERYSDQIRYIYQSNSGAAAARNTGIREAGCELIAFLDSDDVWLPEKTEKQIRLMAESDIVLSYTNLMESRNGVEKDYFSVKGLGFDKDPEILDYPLKTFLRKGGCGIWTSTVMCRKYAVERVGCFDRRMRIYEDVRLWERLAFEGKWGVISNPLARRIWSSPGEQLMDLENRAFHRESVHMRLEIFMEAYAHAVNQPPEVQHRLRELIADDQLNQAKYFACEGEYKKVRPRALESLVFGSCLRNIPKAMLGVLSPRLFGALVRWKWGTV